MASNIFFGPIFFVLFNCHDDGTHNCPWYYVKLLNTLHNTITKILARICHIISKFKYLRSYS